MAGVEPAKGGSGPGGAGGEAGRKAVYLLPGQLVVAEEPNVVTTILGSCVAVCIWDPVLRVGGMNHFLLPRSLGSEESLRFGDVATRRLIERLVLLTGTRRNLQAKVFGGASMIAARHRNGDPLGSKNVESALQSLRNESIPLVTEDTRGHQGRKVIFQTDDGAAWVRRL